MTTPCSAVVDTVDNSDVVAGVSACFRYSYSVVVDVGGHPSALVIAVVTIFLKHVDAAAVTCIRTN